MARFRRSTTLLATCSVAVFGALPVWAQAAPPPSQDTPPASATPSTGTTGTVVAEQQAEQNGAEAGDIVVTAQKRAQSLRDVPIAITVVSSEQLGRQQIVQVDDLKRVAPSLEFGAPGQSPGGGAFIRGLGTTISSVSSEPSASLVIDGVPQGNIPLLNIFDVARVEVLRGPQGTLFGQSVSAGVINISTVTPKIGEFSGSYRTEVSGDNFAGSKYGRWINQLAVNVPLSDKAALRVAGHFDNVNGVGRNVLLGKDSDNNDFGGRARLLVKPTDNLTINLSAEYNRTVGKNTPFFSYRDTTSPLLNSVLQNCGVKIGEANGNWCSPTADRNTQTLFGFAGQFDLDLGGVTLTSISSFRTAKAVTFRTIDHLPASSPASPFPNITFGPSVGDQQLFSQEVRLTSRSGGTFEWVAGGFYSNYGQDFDNLSTLNLFFLPQPVVTSVRYSPRIKSAAGFGQGTIRLNEDLRFILGGRITRNTVRAQNTVQPTATVYANERSVTDFSWKVGAQYDILRRSTLYATISEGFKGQSFDDQTNIATIPVYVKPEIPTAYEIGLKGSVLNGRIGYDLNGFWTDVKNFQAQICVPSATLGIVCSSQNVSKVTSKGFEAAVFGQLFKGFTINTGLAYVHATYPSDFRGTDGGDLGGKQILNSPRWKGSLSGEYETAVSNRFNAFVSGDGTYRSRVRYDTTSTDRVTFRPHWIAGSRIGIRTQDDKLEFAIFAKNLFNVHEPLLLFNSPIGASAATATSPAQTTTTQIVGESSYRLVGASAQLRF
jgi:iron complex outermembrane receptor protein